MPAINFMARFACAVEQGAKRQTVRRVRKRPIRPGDTLYLYTGMRTAACRRLRVVECAAVQTLTVDAGGRPALDDAALSAAAADRFARADGLADWAELRAFLGARYGLPFSGVVIQW